MSLCYIGIGSNVSGILGSPLETVCQAVELVNQLQQVRVVSQSKWYGSKAVGPGSQLDYVNGVILVETRLTPLDLLGELQTIEKSSGRVRNERWGPRTLDLDILFFGDTEIHEPSLTLPHPRIMERPFVVFPLHDLNPSLQLPCGEKVSDLKNAFPKDACWRIAQPK